LNWVIIRLFASTVFIVASAIVTVIVENVAVTISSFTVAAVPDYSQKNDPHYLLSLKSHINFEYCLIFQELALVAEIIE